MLLYSSYVTCYIDDLLGDEGVRKQDLVNWYLGEMQEEIASLDELAEVKLKVEKIIDKLVHQVSLCVCAHTCKYDVY